MFTGHQFCQLLYCIYLSLSKRERWLWWSDVGDCCHVSQLVLYVPLALLVNTSAHSSCGQTQPHTDSPAETWSPLKPLFTAWKQFSNQAFNVNNCLHLQPCIHSQRQTTWQNRHLHTIESIKWIIQECLLLLHIIRQSHNNLCSAALTNVFNLEDQKLAD